MLSVTQFCGFMAGKLPPQLEYVDGRSSGATLTTYSFGSVPLGSISPSPTRLVVVCISGFRDVGGTVASATIGGVTATIARNTSIGNGSIAMIYAEVPTGTTATVSITWSTLQAGTSIATYVMDGLQSNTHDSAGVDTTDPLNLNTTVQPEGIIIAHGKNYGNNNFTWTGTQGIVENYDAGIGTSVSHTAASAYKAGGGTGTIICTPSIAFSLGGMHYLTFS